jgi:hypothetical protein
MRHSMHFVTRVRVYAFALPQRLLPCFKNRTAECERLLLRNHANAHFSISIDRKRIHPTAAEINVSICARFGTFSKSRFASLRYSRAFSDRCMIERDHFFRRKPHRQRTLRAVNPRIDLAVALELDA